MFKKLGVTAVACGSLVAAAPAAADTATCRLDGPMAVKYTPGHGAALDGGRIRVRSSGEITCAGILGGQPVSTAPGTYRLGGWAMVRQGCTIITDSYLRLDAQVQRLISVWTDPIVETTADLNLLGPLSGASVSGIGGVAEQGLDIAGSSSWLPKAGATCANGRLAMSLTLRDGSSRPNRTTMTRQAPAQPAETSAPRSATKARKAKRCARKARTAKAKRAARRCRRAAARRR